MATDLLIQPVTVAAKSVILHYLEQAEAACERLADPEDTEALHDFRVALRRLRSTEKAFRRPLERYFPKKLRKKIKNLASSTGIARDTEVQLQWLARQEELIKPHEAAGFNWLQQRLQQRLAAEYETLRQDLPRSLPKIAQELRDRFAGKQHAEDELFCTAVAQLLEEAGDELLAHLVQVHSANDHAQVHAARIAGKRLRYLLEPVASELPEAKALVKELKRLQDLTGDIHDNQVLATELMQASEEAGAEHFRKMVHLSLHLSPDSESVASAKRDDERPGLMALARDLHQAHQDLFGRLLAKIEAGEHEQLYRHLQALTATLNALPEAPDDPAEAQ